MLDLFLFMWKAGKESERKRMREERTLKRTIRQNKRKKERVAWNPTIHFTDAQRSQRWGQAKIRNQKCIWVSHRSGRDSRTWVIIAVSRVSSAGNDVETKQGVASRHSSIGCGILSTLQLVFIHTISYLQYSYFNRFSKQSYKSISVFLFR